MEPSPDLGSNDVHHAEPENITDGDAARLDSLVRNLGYYGDIAWDGVSAATQAQLAQLLSSLAEKQRSGRLQLEDLEHTVTRMESRETSLVEGQEQLAATIEALERDKAQQQFLYSESVAQVDRLKLALHKKTQEVARLQGEIRSQQEQFGHKYRKKELEFERLKEHLQTIARRAQNTGVTIVNSGRRTVTGVGAGKKAAPHGGASAQVEAYALAIQRKNQVETELRAENAGLRTLIAEIGNELDTLMGQIQAESANGEETRYLAEAQKLSTSAPTASLAELRATLRRAVAAHQAAVAAVCEAAGGYYGEDTPGPANEELSLLRVEVEKWKGLAETQQALIEDYISAPAQRCDGLDESAMAHPLANQREPFSDRENYDAGAQGYASRYKTERQSRSAIAALPGDADASFY